MAMLVFHFEKKIHNGLPSHAVEKHSAGFMCGDKKIPLNTAPRWMYLNVPVAEKGP